MALSVPSSGSWPDLTWLPTDLLCNYRDKKLRVFATYGITPTVLKQRTWYELARRRRPSAHIASALIRAKAAWYALRWAFAYSLSFPSW